MNILHWHDKYESPAAGAGLMALAGFLFAVMAACVYEAKVLAPEASASVTSFVRVFVNLVMIAVPAAFAGNFSELWGDRRAELWLRGFFGGLCLMTYFFAIQMIGVSEGMFLQSMNGAFIVLLAPFFVSERYSGWAFAAVAGSLAGLFLLYDPSLGAGHFYGQMIGLASGFLSALACLMIARAGKSNTPECVVFYFCIVSVFIHLTYFLAFGFSLPLNPLAWLPMIGAGVSAGMAQIYMTKAYQLAPTSLVTSVSYTSAIFGLLFSVLFFGEMLSPRGLLGCTVILLCGVVLPYLRLENGIFSRIREWTKFGF